MPQYDDNTVLCIGSALWDTIASSSSEITPGNDLPGIIRRRPGGVALNIALALVEQGQKAALLTTIGKDQDGDALLGFLETSGVDCRFVTRTDDPTDNYLAIETPSGEVFGAIADCASLERAGDLVLSPLRDGRLADSKNHWRGTSIIDGNLPVSVLESISANNDLTQSHLSFVPASPGKAARMLAALKSQHGTLFVNKGEAEIICGTKFDDSFAAAAALREMGARRAIVTDGPRAAALMDENFRISAEPPKVDAKTTTGAGDVFLARFIAGEIALESDDDLTNEQLLHILSQAVIAAGEHVMKDNS